MTTQGSLLDSIFASGGGGEGTAGVVDTLFDVKKARLKMITEVTPDLVYPLALLSTIQQRYRSKLLDDFSSQFYQLQISRDRKGRAELIEALLATRSGMGDE